YNERNKDKLGSPPQWENDSTPKQETSILYNSGKSKLILLKRKLKRKSLVQIEKTF
ncbi:uncharacterized protein K444DRAFT_612487, partial [Hyaloscypha bicolor E]